MPDFLIITILLIFQVFIPGFPKELLLLQAGANYGLVGGSIINFIGMLAGGQMAYELARLYEEQFKQMINFESERTKKLRKIIDKYGILGLFYFRILPFSPNDVISILSGILKLNRKYFFIITAITAIPYAVLFAYLGSLAYEYKSILRYLGYINLVFIGIGLVFVIILIYNIKINKQNNAD